MHRRGGGGGRGHVHDRAGQKEQKAGDEAHEQGEAGLDRKDLHPEGGEDVQKPARGDQGEDEQGGPDAEHPRRVGRVGGVLQYQQPEGQFEEQTARARQEQSRRGGQPGQGYVLVAQPDALRIVRIHNLDESVAAASSKAADDATTDAAEARMPDTMGFGAAMDDDSNSKG